MLVLVSDTVSVRSWVRATSAFDSSASTEAQQVFRNMSTPRSGGLGPMTEAVPLNQPHFFQLGQVLSDVAFELFMRDFVVSFQCLHEPKKINSRRARFHCAPDSCGNWIEAVAEPLSNIEKHSAIFGICGTDVWRNQPFGVGIRFHAFPPSEVSWFEANGLGAGWDRL